MRGRGFLASCLLILLAASLSAQEPGQATPVPRRLLLSVQGGTGSPPEDLLGVEKSVAFAIMAEGNGIVVVEYGNTPFPDSLEDRIAVTKKAGADGWLFVGIKEDKSSAALVANAYDIRSGAVILDDSFDWPAAVLPLDSIVAPISQKLQSSALAAAPRGPRTARLTLKALPGTLITGLPMEPETVGPDGSLSLTLDAPATFTFNAGLAGYRPVSQSFYLDSDKEIAVVQERGSRWSFDLEFFDALFPGFDAAFFVVPDYAFIRLGLTTFRFGLKLATDDPFYSLPLTDFVFRAGSYLAPEDWTIRPYAAIGGFLRLLRIAGTPPRLEPISPGGLELTLAAELGLGPKSRFFLELSPLLYFSDSPDLLLSSFGETTPFGYISLPWGVLSLANLRFGFRWLL